MNQTGWATPPLVDRPQRAASFGLSPAAASAIRWYRSRNPPPKVQVSKRRAVRDRLRAWLPEPDVRDKIMVLYSRRTFPKLSSSGVRLEFHGLFSEFHSVLGALAYGEAHGAVGLRIAFRSPLYVEADRGPNWWRYFFDRDEVRFNVDRYSTRSEIHLDRFIAKYGRHGGFSDVVHGSTPYLYPMTYGMSRLRLHGLLNAYIGVCSAIREEAARFIETRFEPGAFVVGVHYRGTDATHRWTGTFNHYRRLPAPYGAYVHEVRQIYEMAAPRVFQVFVATDEIEFLELMQREFGDRVVHLEESPRVHAGSQAVHLDRRLEVSNYQKGRSALMDCLLLAAANYLVKGRSNLSDASLVFNPELPYSFCPDAGIW
jgi:hypothetical protein